MKNIEKRYQCSFHGFKEKSNRKNNLAIQYDPHLRSNAAASNLGYGHSRSVGRLCYFYKYHYYSFLINILLCVAKAGCIDHIQTISQPGLYFFAYQGFNSQYIQHTIIEYGFLIDFFVFA